MSFDGLPTTRTGEFDSILESGNACISVDQKIRRDRDREKAIEGQLPRLSDAID